MNAQEAVEVMKRGGLVCTKRAHGTFSWGWSEVARIYFTCGTEENCCEDWMPEEEFLNRFVGDDFSQIEPP